MPGESKSNSGSHGLTVKIIGGGNVGGTIAFALLHSNRVKAISITDIDRGKERAIQMDLEDAAYLTEKTITTDGQNADITVITAGKAQRIGQSRKSLYRANQPVVEGYVAELNKAKYTGRVIIITNPVDTLTQEMMNKYPGLNFIPINLQLDNVRLKVQGTTGEVIGSHDEGQTVLVNNIQDKEATERIRQKAQQIISGKGYTCYGIAEVVKNIIEKGQHETGE